MKNTVRILSRYSCLIVAVLVYLNSLSVWAQCSVTNDLTIPDTYLAEGFSGGGNFNAVVIGDLNTGDGISEGRVAVGGNFTLNSSISGYQVGLVGMSPVTGENFIVNGMLTHNTGNQIDVRGNFYYGSVEGSTPLPNHAAGEGTNINENNRILFSGLKQHYIDLSNTYQAQAATNGPDPINSGANLVLTGDNTVKNYVFNVNLTGNALSNVSFTDIPVGSGILINILNSFVNLSAVGVSMPGDHKAKTLFNFPNATSILLSAFSVQGGFLAPNANLSGLGASEIVGPLIIGGDVTQVDGFSFKSSCLDYSLPVTLVGFKASREGQTANLAWETSTEVNADRFIVERSIQGKKWEILGEVAATGERIREYHYTFSDTNPLQGSNLYRLKMLDQDGTFGYSSIVSVDFKFKSAISAFPNPATSVVNFTSQDWVKIDQVQVLALTGKSLINHTDPGKAINVSNLPHGMYLIKITEKNGGLSTQKFLKK